LQELGFKIASKPEGAFYIYANCQQFTEDSFQFAHDLLEATGVAVTPGKDFGQHAAQHHLRFAYTTSLARLQEAVQRLHQFINERKG
jgi:aspartate/methionine/tyrosine aminotransferase